MNDIFNDIGKDLKWHRDNKDLSELLHSYRQVIYSISIIRSSLPEMPYTDLHYAWINRKIELEEKSKELLKLYRELKKEK